MIDLRRAVKAAAAAAGKATTAAAAAATTAGGGKGGSGSAMHWAPDLAALVVRYLRWEVAATGHYKLREALCAARRWS